MSDRQSLKIFFVVGEASGDLLGADLLGALKSSGARVEAAGLAGEKMTALGVKSLFDISQLSIMGVSAIVARLPRLFARVRQTAREAARFKPDIVVLIDSPEFSHAVARRIRPRLPGVPIVKYVCPSVWAWRPGRAAKMKAYVDHVLAILPFEPQVLAELGGPPATFVGHPLSARLDEFPEVDRSHPGETLSVLLLPGSRMSEVKRLMPIMRDTLEVMRQRGMKYQATLPVVDHLAQKIADEMKDWPVRAKVVSSKTAKARAFAGADVALACSGTVMLELGLHSIPTVSIYKLDPLAMPLRFLISGWTANLVNLITDSVIVPERFNEFANPQYLARNLELLTRAGPARQAQIEGFRRLREKITSEGNPGRRAAEKVLELAGRR